MGFVVSVNRCEKTAKEFFGKSDLSEFVPSWTMWSRL